VDPLSGTDEPVVGLEARYLASIETYGSREAALASLLSYVLPPTYVEENDLGFVFRYLMWPMAEETPTLIWPETNLRGLPRGGCLLSHNPYDMVQACLIRDWVRAGLLTKKRGYIRNKKKQEVMVNTGLSPEGNDTLWRFLPIGKSWGGKEHTKHMGYPDYILRATKQQEILLAAVNSDVDKIEGERLVYLDLMAYFDRHPFITKRAFGPRKSRTFSGYFELNGIGYYGVDRMKLLAEIEGGDYLRQR
jgi:hypothetical protein